jgi:hypothetical protein
MTFFMNPKAHVKRKFTLHEDKVLRSLVEKCGPDDWAMIASQMPHRDSRQCRERWFHYLSPELVQCPWTPADDSLLELRVAEHGHKWKMFEVEFPGRTNINLKNRFNVLVRRRMRQPWTRHAGMAEGDSRVQNVAASALSPEASFWWDTDLIDWQESSES